jgi:hypothetical protein
MALGRSTTISPNRRRHPPLPLSGQVQAGPTGVIHSSWITVGITGDLLQPVLLRSAARGPSRAAAGFERNYRVSLVMNILVRVIKNRNQKKAVSTAKIPDLDPLTKQERVSERTQMARDTYLMPIIRRGQ